MPGRTHEHSYIFVIVELVFFLSHALADAEIEPRYQLNVFIHRHLYVLFARVSRITDHDFHIYTVGLAFLHELLELRTIPLFFFFFGCAVIRRSEVIAIRVL